MLSFKVAAYFHNTFFQEHLSAAACDTIKNKAKLLFYKPEVTAGSWLWKKSNVWEKKKFDETFEKYQIESSIWVVFSWSMNFSDCFFIAMWYGLAKESSNNFFFKLAMPRMFYCKDDSFRTDKEQLFKKHFSTYSGRDKFSSLF